jgi:chromosome partitioning protein
MVKLAIVNMKGGVGKTTTSVNLAIGIAARGRRVLLVDMDPQGNVAHSLKIRAHQNTIFDLMADDMPVDQVIRPGVRPNLDIIPSSNVAFGLENRLAGETLREKIFTRRMRGVGNYDFTFIDTSPAMSLLTVNTLLYVDWVLLPVSMDQMAIIGAVQSLAGLKRVLSAFESPEKRILVLPTMVNASTNGSKETIAAMQEDPDLAQYLLPVSIRQDVKLSYAAASKGSIWEYDPRTRAAEDYTRLVDYLLEITAHADQETGAAAAKT